LLGEDLKSDGIGPIPQDASVKAAERAKPDVALIHRHGATIATPYYPLAVDKVRYVGEAVVLVIAGSLAIAPDAAEPVPIDYEALPAVVAAQDAAEPGAPLVWDRAQSNVFLDAELGDAASTDAAFAGAAHVVSFETWVQRVTGVPMEARTAVGNYDAQSKR